MRNRQLSQVHNLRFKRAVSWLNILRGDAAGGLCVASATSAARCGVALNGQTADAVGRPQRKPPDDAHVGARTAGASLISSPRPGVQGLPFPGPVTAGCRSSHPPVHSTICSLNARRIAASVALIYAVSATIASSRNKGWEAREPARLPRASTAAPRWWPSRPSPHPRVVPSGDSGAVAGSEAISRRSTSRK
jgi:hypothetical protein